MKKNNIKKILLICHLGSRTNARPDQIAKYLSKEGFKVHLVLWDVPYPLKLFIKNFFGSLIYKKYRRGNVVIHKIRRLPFFFPPVNKPWVQSQIRSIFLKNKIDMIISESYINEMEPPSDLPFIYSLVDDFESYAELYGSKIYKLAFKLLEVRKTIENQMKGSKSVIVVSTDLLNYATKFNKNVFKIPNGVESWVFKKQFKKRKYDFGEHALIYVSGFDYWSNLPNLLYAVNAIKKDIPDIQLILVGNGYQIPEGKKIVKKLGLENVVTFFGQINDRKELFKIINSCDVCLNLSEKNKRQDAASSIKVFEYSALGKSIVSTRLKEIEALKFPNVTFYNDREDNSDLIKAIKKGFNKKINIKEIKKLIEPYTWENIAKMFIKILNCVK